MTLVDAYGYEVLIAPYRDHPRGGEWLIRVYDGTGQHIHSAEGGVSLDVGLREVLRAVEADQQERASA